jgi:hypothetical protein
LGSNQSNFAYSQNLRLPLKKQVQFFGLLEKIWLAKKSSVTSTRKWSIFVKFGQKTSLVKKNMIQKFWVDLDNRCVLTPRQFSPTPSHPEKQSYFCKSRAIVPLGRWWTGRMVAFTGLDP